MQILHGNNLEILKTLEDNSIDAIVTDPPYGLGKEPNASLLMQDWIQKGYHEVSGSGFMGKEWDAFVPQPIFWKEIYRVLKPGGHVLSFFGTRTYDWGVMAMRFAGFEVRDCIQWLYGTGFPKSYNIAKGIEGKIVNGSASWNDWKKLDGEKEENNWGYSKKQAEQGYRNDYSESNKERVGKVNFHSKEAKYWNGWGSALKPANEPIVLARKPLEKGLSIADNVLKWGTGGINIDDCRISTKDKTQRTNNEVEWGRRKDEYYENREKEEFGSTLGRFPANVILGCICESKDEHNEDCPIKILDEQSGVLKSGAMNSIAKGGQYNVYSKMNERRVVSPPSVGGASRFFYVAKASQSERNKGLEDLGNAEQNLQGLDTRGRTLVREDGSKTLVERFVPKPRANNHPTVKPIKLMQYLVRLVTPPNGVVLDPFLGSGTTGIACKLEKFNFIGIEQDESYHKIAKARIENFVEEENTSEEEYKITQTQLF
jgi:DNA modification methylase